MSSELIAATIPERSNKNRPADRGYDEELRTREKRYEHEDWPSDAVRPQEECQISENVNVAAWLGRSQSEK